MQINNEKIYSELLSAGVVGLSFSWDDTGVLHFAKSIPEEQRAAIRAVFDNHTPDPVVAVPQTITMRQAKLALLHAGLLDDVNTAVAQAERATQVEWEYATEIRRDWPTLLQVQAVLELTDEQVDALFVTAHTL